MITLKQYQEQAVRDLLNASLKWCVRTGTHSLVFRAPTGSGKTVVMQEFLRRFSITPHIERYAVMWISVGDLAKQSKESFVENVSNTGLRFSELSDISDKQLHENEILFLNWESIRSKDAGTGEWKNIAMLDGEKDASIPVYMENTKQAGIEIILVIDESHTNLSGPRAQELIASFIKPKLQIEVSATPKSMKYQEMITVSIADVIDTGMIKQEVLINPGFTDFANPEDLSTDEFMIKMAIEKQCALKKQYIAMGSPVQPLLLIQLPSEAKTMNTLDTTKLEHTRKILKEQYDITIENKRLGVWLSDKKDKVNLGNIKSNSSTVEVLIFKQAIATGWDCPRAQILVMFREIQSFEFQIQTIGRILRMPEQRHYDEKDLNKAYVYTNLSRAMISVEQAAQLLIKKQWAKLKDGLVPEDFSLPMQYVRRTDYRDIGASFYNEFASTLLSYIGGSFMSMTFENREQLAKHIDVSNTRVTNRILSDGKILVDIDEQTGQEIIALSEIETKTESELIGMSFDQFCRSQVGPEFTNVSRSFVPIKEALYGTLEKFIFGTEKTRLDIQALVLNHTDFFKQVFTIARKSYKPKREAEIADKDEVKPLIWQIPSMQSFPDSALMKSYTKYVYAPTYISTESKGEILFIEHFLEKSDRVLWWYKNGIKSEQFFSLPYMDESSRKANFFPDFIVGFIDGTIGIFDTKDGITLEAGKPKAKALSYYISNEVSGGKKMIGGLIVVKEKGDVIEFYINKTADYTVGSMEGFVRLS